MDEQLERLKAQNEYTINQLCKGQATISSIDPSDFKLLIQQAERVKKTVKRNKELEYASKYNGELNEFLQKRKLPLNTLGRHVVDVVMDYVQELEEESKQMNKHQFELRKDAKEWWITASKFQEENEALESEIKRYKERVKELEQELEDATTDAQIADDNYYFAKRYEKALEFAVDELYYAHLTGDVGHKDASIKRVMDRSEEALKGETNG
ncbi:hypothetical protein [Virgibacillus salexigens]|uniref:Uncharacterized protein n=1 Tax=Virgibacillus massiliensis TaxID=1462526 RepID=A0A024QH44_9BACI|nr:hypothetical protein [Virgibacillus massiliensis]CDQ41883.1 hypothetical protein BN990_04262 [Virgibacillus massiliensis]